MSQASPPARINPLDWDLGNVPPGIPWGGVDEAGRGAWAGPVVAACAVLDPACVARWGHVLRSARDSKRLQPDRREVLAAELRTVLPAWSVVEVDNLAVDRENILEATLSAMRGAVRGLGIVPRILFVDGDRAPRSGLPERLVVDGDVLSCAVACASILAKAHRDAWMREQGARWPDYGFARHKGYGTPEHRGALDRLGPSPIHRLSYRPVAARLRPDEALRDRLRETLDRPASVEDLKSWVEQELRPAYGQLKPLWVETLRRRYAERLAQLAAGEGLE
ncbi:MAG: ribonuclease HII [Acidobacteria bacterium]|nr:ribonuclease HII [Acidobacteriota bacterium]